jgi:PAS domain S-box-containing protein
VRLAVEAGRIGLWDLDLATQRIEWSAETAAIFGMRLEDFGGDWASFAANVQPDDVQAIEEQIARITPALGAFEYEMRVGRDGEWTRRVLSRGQVIADAEGHPSHMVGMVADVTEQWRQSEEISRILESIGDAFYALDAAGRFTYVNAEAARLLQRRPADLLGRVVWEEFPEGVGTEFEENFRRAFVRQQVVSFEARYAPLDGWFELRVFPTPTGISVYFRNIDELRAAERERQALEQEREAAAGRTAHLGAVAAALAEALREGDVTRIVLDNARAALGARGGAIALFEPGTDELHFAAVGWPEPEAEEVLRSDLTADRPTTEAARRRVPVFVTGPDDLTRRFPAMVELFARVGDQAIASVPLLVHGDCLGAMTLTWTEPRAFSDEDRQFVAALGDTCAQALERARLYEREHRVAETLQLALLPERLADPDGISSAARYLPGTEGVAVGGDWYDLFDLGDSRLGIVLGDVVGKGVGAAAVMGRLRNALRAYATVVDDPAEVLARVDDFAGRFGSNDLATLVYGVLDTGTGELRFSSAGHLPPLAVRADGYTGYLAGDPDLPVGVSAPVGRTEHRVRFSSGTTLVLYSDGLVEDRKRSLDDGLQLLAEVAAATAGSDADATCDRIVTELVGAAGGDDDVAVLVLQWDGPPSPERCTAVLPPVVASARRARALVTEQLEQWGEDELQETAQLCVSEIVTNAVVHAGTPVQLDVILTADRVRIEVVDGGAAPPERVEADDEDVHGRGIAIVELLSSDWGVERRDDGKCVWFELERTAGGPPTSAAS